MEAKDSAKSSGARDESSDLVVELNVKTLDSRIFKFHVDKNMRISLFKEKIANETGLPVIQQRLIFRGKVLKDDQLLSEYDVDNGHTLHLVERQLAGSPSSNSAALTNTDNGGATSSRNRVGHISHRVVLGTLNLGDQPEGVVPDLSGVIGAVLNSIGIGGQAMPGGVPTVQINAPGHPQPGNVAERSQNGSGIPSQTQQGQGLPNQSLPQVMRITRAAIPIPTLNTPISDSLHTLSDFMSQMELVLPRNGYGPNHHPRSAGDSPPVEVTTNSRGLSTHESLSSIIRQAERLLSSNATAALSHVAGRLEREGGSTDPTVRGQIQTESIQVGRAIQHLGSLFLELGRTILTLRMGQSPAETFVNSGPAVYISSFGPNPIMVQPFPLQATTMFGISPPNSSNQSSFQTAGIRTVPRNVSIHIHTAIAPGASVEERLQGEPHNRSADSGQTQMSTVIAGINPQPRSFSDNMQTGNPVPSGQSENTSVESRGVSNAQRGSPSMNPFTKDGDTSATPGGLPECKGHKENKGGPSNLKGTALSSSGGDSHGRSVQKSEDTPSAPLGLGMGSLKPKSRVKPERSQDKRSSSEFGGSDDSNVEEQIRETLKSFTDRSSETPLARQTSNSQFNIANAMSQVLNNPAFSGLLSGVSQQTGIESPNTLKNMMMQITQNPAMMNSIGHMAQQLQGQQDSSGRLPPTRGGMDLSRMFQKMMPLVSQALSGCGSSVPGSSLPQQDDLQNIPVDFQDVLERIENRDTPREIFCSLVLMAAQLDDTCSNELIQDLCHNEDLAKEFIDLLQQDISRRLDGVNKKS